MAYTAATSSAMAGLVTYDANAAFVAMELSGSESSTFGSFSVGYGTTPGSFTAFSSAQHTNSFSGNANIQGYFVNNPQIVPAVAVNISGAPTTMVNIGSVLDKDQIYLHPGAINTANAEGGPIQNAILRFTAPVSGLYTVVGDWVKLHFGTTSDQILVNGQSAFPSASGTSSFNFSKFLNANDHVDFVVDPAGVIAGDSTGLRATLTATTKMVGSLPTPDKFTSQVVPFALNNNSVLTNIASQNGNNSYQVSGSNQQLMNPLSKKYLKDNASAIADNLNSLSEKVYFTTSMYDGYAESVSGGIKRKLFSAAKALGEYFGISLANYIADQSGNPGVQRSAVLVNLLNIIGGCVTNVLAGDPKLIKASLVACDANLIAFDIQNGLVPLLQIYAIDPPNPYYKTVAAINIQTVNVGDSTVQPTIDALLAVQAYLAAVNETYDRYVSAYNAGDTDSALLQIQAYLTFLEQYNNAMLQAKQGIAAVLNDIVANNVDVNPADLQTLIAQVQQEIAANGLDSDTVNMLEGLGLDAAQILGVQNDILGFQYSPTGSLRDNVNGLLVSLDAISVPNAVPEPTALVLFATSGFALIFVQRRRRKVATLWH